MLEGELIVRVGPASTRSGRGDLVDIPRGVVDAHRNRASVPTRWLTLFTPAGGEGYFAERADLAGTAGDGVELDYAGLEPAVDDAAGTLRDRRQRRVICEAVASKTLGIGAIQGSSGYTGGHALRTPASRRSNWVASTHRHPGRRPGRGGARLRRGLASTITSSTTAGSSRPARASRCPVAISATCTRRSPCSPTWPASPPRPAADLDPAGAHPRAHRHRQPAGHHRPAVGRPPGRRRGGRPAAAGSRRARRPAWRTTAPTRRSSTPPSACGATGAGLMDDYVEAMIAIWTQEPASYHERAHQLRRPGGPSQAGAAAHIPIWVGGRSDKALERVVRYGQTWNPSQVSPAQFEASWAWLDERFAAAGRPPAHGARHQYLFSVIADDG